MWKSEVEGRLETWENLRGRGKISDVVGKSQRSWENFRCHGKISDVAGKSQRSWENLSGGGKNFRYRKTISDVMGKSQRSWESFRGHGLTLSAAGILCTRISSWPSQHSGKKNYFYKSNRMST